MKWIAPLGILKASYYTILASRLPHNHPSSDEMYYVLVIAAATLHVALSCPSPQRLSDVQDCSECQLQRFNFSALNRYPTSQLGVLQLFKMVTFQYLRFEFHKLTNTSAFLRIRCHGSLSQERCASAILIQEQHSGQDRLFLQTVRSDGGSLSLDNDWLEISIVEPSNKTILFSVCDEGRVFWKIGRMPLRMDVPTVVMYRQLTETIPCWNYDEDSRTDWKTSCNISTERYRELAREMVSVVWYDGKGKRLKIVVVVILLMTGLAVLGYILLTKSFVRVAPTP